MVRDPDAMIYFRGNAIEIRSRNGRRIIGFERIVALYVHQDIAISVKTAIRIAKRVPLRFIDKRNKVHAKIVV
jgi:hypothetical protein